MATCSSKNQDCPTACSHENTPRQELRKHVNVDEKVADAPQENFFWVAMIGCTNAPADSTIPWRCRRFTSKSLEEPIVDHGMGVCSSLAHQSIRTLTWVWKPGPGEWPEHKPLIETNSAPAFASASGVSPLLFSFSVIALLVMPMQISTGTSLDSVETFLNLSKRWTKLCDDQPLAQLHAKFWGKSMAEEEEAWRARQHSTSNPSDTPTKQLDRNLYTKNIPTMVVYCGTLSPAKGHLPLKMGNRQ